MGIAKERIKLTPKLFRFPKVKKRKYLMFGTIILLVIISAVIIKSMPLTVNVITLQPKDFTKGFTEEGEVIAAQEWPIYNSVAGKLESLNVKNGDSVKKGQVLFEINTTDLNYQSEELKAQIQSLEGQRLQSSQQPYEAQIAQQKLLIQQAEKDVETEQSNAARMKALYDAGSISMVQYQDAQAAYERANNLLEQQKSGLDLIYEQHQVSQGTELYYENQKKALQTQIEQLEDEIAKAKIVAKQDGVIKDLVLKEGSLVPMGEQVMTIFSNQGYKLESYVLASDALDVKAGSPVQLIQSTSTGNKILAGRVDTLDVAAVEKVSPLGLKENRVKVTISLTEPSPQVVLGSTLDVEFTTVKASNQLMVPKTALFPYQEGYAVWIIQDGKAKIRPVIKGLENDSEVIIEEGLAKDDVILLDPNLQGLKEGKPVKAIL
ncbi:multidrug resistance efflux pump [Desulfosporosinus orientis DSM 765]|uniref:Multidrug resistance efflux pump n=1 Tax=Desulfosporosinus orientis (strain ATCC 19365 / DSM 765 / NCIMB 8382 / VKM B-1628 / Singapore I) TaxID=768706 RepID=G7WC03_DESOD|nr:biotin/lipoyl-binding protein [Desulfosporosinus orientis]AET69977.1 multidrug resistance efflux pump [Desulfosporosinus orientis DSM 765]